VDPMLATRAHDGTALPRGADWWYEVKWDGVRVITDTTGPRMRLRARSGSEVTAAWPELAGLSILQGAVLDGEVVVMAGGTPSFEALAERMHVRDAAVAARLAARRPATYVVFDVLALYGVNLTRRPLAERRDVLDRLDLPDHVQVSPVYLDVDDLWAATLEHGLEGVVAKRRTSTYQPGRRSPDWVKAAHRMTRVAAVVGWRPEARRAGGPLGALLLAAPDADGAWRYLGRAGSGLAGRAGQLVATAVSGADSGQPLDGVPRVDADGTFWCAPSVLVDVVYLQRTRGGRLRHPVVRGLRADVPVDPWEEP